MNIVILGAGQVGSELSAILASDHDVTLIDLNQEKLQKFLTIMILRRFAVMLVIQKLLSKLKLKNQILPLL
ncbi:MAG: hypothetical protein CM15mP22_2330 [Gammaproteobacteria bacterium]|nr:MAG: hypothetical protein CM15mP22_2330 [Gammaproteobacteria bacterium]